MDGSTTVGSKMAEIDVHLKQWGMTLFLVAEGETELYSQMFVHECKADCGCVNCFMLGKMD